MKFKLLVYIIIFAVVSGFSILTGCKKNVLLDYRIPLDNVWDIDSIDNSLVKGENKLRIHKVYAVNDYDSLNKMNPFIGDMLTDKSVDFSRQTLLICLYATTTATVLEAVNFCYWPDEDQYGLIMHSKDLNSDAPICLHLLLATTSKIYPKKEIAFRGSI